MGVTDVRNRGVAVVADRPFIALLAFIGAYLLLDLALKLAGTKATVGGTRVIGGDVLMSSLASKLTNGLLRGLVIGLAGIGLSMTYSILGFANFAHGDTITAGAFIGTATSFVVAGVLSATNYDLGALVLVQLNSSQLNMAITNTPVAILIGLVVTAVVTVALVLAVDRVAFKPIRGRDGITLLITSIGVALTLRYLVNFVFGTSKRNTYEQGIAGRTSFNFIDGTVAFDAHDLLLVVVAGGLMLGTHLILQQSKLGKAMRAMADNKDLARVTGIPTERVIQFTWVLGGALTGVAGYTWVLWRGVFGWFDGWLFLLLVFAAVILGGIGSIYGAIAGGIVIGLTFDLSTIFIPPALGRAAAFALMIVVLVVAPSGLFKGRTTA